MWILTKAKGRKLVLQALDITEELRIDLSVAIDEGTAERLRERREIMTADIAETLRWLRGHFVFAHPESGEDSVLLGRFDNDSPSAYTLLGAGWRAEVRDRSGHFELERILPLSRSREPSRLALIRGKVDFYDASVGARLQSDQYRSLLEAAMRDNGSYLKLWQEYGELEWRKSVDQARSLGSISYSSASSQEGETWVWRLSIEDREALAEFRERWRELEFTSEDQLEVSASGPDWNLAASPETLEPEERALRGRPWFEDNAIVITPAQDRKTDRPPVKGHIYYSLSGYAAVRKRRLVAKQAIDEGRGMLQLQLKFLLEGLSPPAANWPRISPLSPSSNACFRGTPTERQESAIDVALNTPDVALIVGPPGTGKTQVIAALQRRLAETMEGSVQHQVLVSSFQHDAVDTALARVDVFGLPPVRIGNRGRRREGGVDILKSWCDRKRDALTARLDALEASEPHWKPLANLHRKLLTTRLAILSPEERFGHLKEIDELLEELAAQRIRLPPSLRERWRIFMDARSLAPSPAAAIEAGPKLLRLIRALRTTASGFADDGADNAHGLLKGFGKQEIPLHPDDKALLERLSYEETPSVADLHAISNLRDRLMDGLRPDYRPPQVKRAPEGEEMELLSEIAQAMDEPIRESRKGAPAVVASFREALSCSPERVEATVQEYAAIVGATCQQAGSGKMMNLKALPGLKGGGVSFDTVIIDEAARANPLDLFVPMALGRRRIVLVGDHRQLPHLLEPELENELVGALNLNDAQREAYRHSLFERLVMQLRERQDHDGVKRIVVLDTQYRMHPVLGEFVSKQFYEPVGLDPIRSGRLATDFVHGVPWYGTSVCAWVDVPFEDGQERKGPGKSRFRDAEARATALELKRITDAVGNNVSVGVITFYRAQSDKILGEMQALGLVEREDGELAIAQEYRATRDGEERIRVGTVDAFQGKEFDIVLLSVVRSSRKRLPSGASAAEREAILNSKYGHLRLSNRMNVAMSRQKSLLVVIGDKGMAEGEEARESVPALAAFLDLCKGESGHVM